MEWKPTKGSLLPTPREAIEALLDYTAIFLRRQVDWLIALGIVKGDDDDHSEPPEDQPPAESSVKHSQVVEEARNYLWHQTRRWLTEPEITLPIGRRVDLMAWARHGPPGDQRRFMIIEAKASLSDFYADYKKMIQQLPWCHLFVYAVPRSLGDRVRKRMESGNYMGCGLLLVPDRKETGSWQQRRMVIHPQVRNMEPEHYVRMLESWGYAIRQHLVGARFEIAEKDAVLKSRADSLDHLHKEHRKLTDVLRAARRAQGIFVWGV